MAIIVESVDPANIPEDTYAAGLSWMTESGTVIVYGANGKRLAEYPQGVWRRAYDDLAADTNPYS